MNTKTLVTTLCLLVSSNLFAETQTEQPKNTTIQASYISERLFIAGVQEINEGAYSLKYGYSHAPSNCQFGAELIYGREEGKFKELNPDALCMLYQNTDWNMSIANYTRFVYSKYDLAFYGDLQKVLEVYFPITFLLAEGLSFTTMPVWLYGTFGDEDAKGWGVVNGLAYQYQGLKLEGSAVYRCGLETLDTSECDNTRRYIEASYTFPIKEVNGLNLKLAYGEYDEIDSGTFPDGKVLTANFSYQY